MSVDLFHFYHVVLQDEMLFFKVTDDQLKRSFITLKRAYCRKALKKCKTFVDFHLSCERCAYLYKFGPCHTQLVSMYFRKFLESARNVYSTLQKANELKICCLGGGPGTDVVGMCSVLVTYEDLWTKLSEVTVLDICGGWRNSFKRVIEKLKQIYPLPENLLSNLISADLMNALSGTALKAVEEADILCMVKFVSTVISNPSAESAFKELASHMKTGAVVIFIDNLDSRILKPLKKYFSESGLKCVFRDFCDQFKVQGDYPSNLKKVEGSETLEYANAYVLGWIKKSCPEADSIQQRSFGATFQSALNIHSVNNKGNYQESCDSSDSDSMYSNHPGKSYSDEGNNFIDSRDLPWSVDLEKCYTHQCTQTEDSEESSNYLHKSDNSNISELHGGAHRTKLYTEHCTQTVKFLCHESSPCANHTYVENLESQLSRISLRLSHLEFLIKNIAAGCSKKVCGTRPCCSDDYIFKGHVSEE